MTLCLSLWLDQLLGEASLQSAWSIAAQAGLVLRRIRKHNCKHIRLVLTQLDIAQAPGKWKEVSLRHCLSFSCAQGIYLT